MNANGTKDAVDSGLPNWTIQAKQGGNVVASTTTDASGNYSFSLKPGTYTFNEVCPAGAGWRQSKPGPTTSIADCGNNTYTETLTSKGSKKGNGFGNFRNATKYGTNFNDLNNNHVRDAGEPGLSGWEIRLIIPGGVVAGTATTDANGHYSFTGITPGINYLVCEVLKTGWEQTFPTSGTDCDAIDPAYAPWGYSITLKSGENDTDNDFGNHLLPSEGCTPGFWSGGVGGPMWDTANDPDWSAGGAQGTNPFIHTTLFNDFFTPAPSLAGLTMFDLVSTGGGSELIRKTARMLVAAYLSSSAGLLNGYTTGQLKTLWTDFITNHPTDDTLFNALAKANNLGCPLPR